MQKSLDKLKQINASFPYSEPIRRWKEQGGKVIGWVCNYVPEEIIYAAGMLPVRIIGGSQEIALDEATACLYGNTCSYVRSCLELGLKSQFDFLDGFVVAASCDGTRRLADAWKYYVSTPFIHVLTVPRRITPHAETFFQQEVLEFKEDLESFFQTKITNQRLSEAIAIYNRTRQLLGNLNELRKSDSPLISGSDAMEVMNSAFRMPKQDFNTLLEELLKEITEAQFHPNGKLRLMLTGSILNNSSFIKSIEDLGAIVVTDELCTGTRYWWDLVDTNITEDPVTALARRYLSFFPCARIEPSEERLNRVVALARDFRVQGVISQVIRCCTTYGHDMPLLQRAMEKEGIPLLELDTEYGMGGTGQIKTRVEAFLETLAGI